MTTIILNLFNAVLTVYTSFLFFRIFGRTKLSRFQIAIMITSLSAVPFLVFTLSVDGLPRIVGISGTIFIVSLFFSIKWLPRILYWSIHIAISIAVEAIVAAMLSVVLSSDMTNSHEGIFFVLGVLISKFVGLLIILGMQLKKNYKIYGITAQKLLLIMLIPTSTLFLMILQYFISKSISGNALLLMTCAYTLLIFSNIAVFEYIDTVCENAVNREKVATATQVINSQIQQMEAAEQNRKNIAKLRHDQKNAYIGMIKELQNGNVLSVINEMSDSIDVLQKKVEEPLDIIETVVEMKKEIACKKNIAINFSYQDPNKLNIQPIDMAVILGNALDNAIEAAEKVLDQERIIDVLIAIENTNVAIAIKNPVVQNIDVDQLSSQKPDPYSHGYGILSMRQVAANYDGQIVFVCEDHVFETYIVLKNINKQKITK